MPSMNNKNWNDRADKDLFFTILSVKQIGVISGGEWSSIGNTMRMLGYGFTNEGCRYVINLFLLCCWLVSSLSRAALFHYSTQVIGKGQPTHEPVWSPLDELMDSVMGRDASHEIRQNLNHLYSDA